MKNNYILYSTLNTKLNNHGNIKNLIPLFVLFILSMQNGLTQEINCDCPSVACGQLIRNGGFEGTPNLDPGNSNASGACWTIQNGTPHLFDVNNFTTGSISSYGLPFFATDPITNEIIYEVNTYNTPDPTNLKVPCFVSGRSFHRNCSAI